LIAILLKGTKVIHEDMIKRVARSPVLFFDSNPIGRIVTKFSKDMTVMDMMIASMANVIVFGILRSIGVAIVISSINPYMLICLPFVFYLMWVSLSQAKPLLI
jgi:ATP-binding cassette subfamily C (CFTR/MRP) protein 4